ncbi:NADH-quinone oxidoreductase subunit D [Verrucomicrobiota bacterium]|nr:NADH-quinone oxidoreductase subunit D [Verrucomicrobiota bacterium]
MKTTKEISLGDIAARAEELRGENMTLNMGPSHPATHGVLRLSLELDGDKVISAIQSSATCTAATKKSLRT